MRREHREVGIEVIRGVARSLPKATVGSGRQDRKGRRDQPGLTAGAGRPMPFAQVSPTGKKTRLTVHHWRFYRKLSGMGPIALFDKSFLQSISTDEAVWFDHFFMPIVCPVFYAETLGNLAKQPTKRGPPEVIVRDIANKFPEWAGSPCVFHTQLVINDLLGVQHIGLRPQIPRPGGRPVKSGTVFEQTPEEEAFQRWKDGKFDDVERITARFWRKALEELDLVAVQKELRSIGFTQQQFKTMAEVKRVVDALVAGTDRPYDLLTLAVHFFQIPQYLHEGISRAWQMSRKRRLAEFAPYAAYALTVEIFFQIALGAGLIGGERPSNRTDVAYLFYLPFAMVFISSDDLHRNLAPLFMRPDQGFIWGMDLKPALKATNEHFLQLPEEIREKGISAFAHAPPPGNAIADAWDRFLRTGYRDEKPVKMDPEEEKRLVEKLKAFTKQETLSSGEASGEEDEMISIVRKVRLRRGSWWQLPKDYEEPTEGGSPPGT